MDQVPEANGTGQQGDILNMVIESVGGISLQPIYTSNGNNQTSVQDHSNRVRVIQLTQGNQNTAVSDGQNHENTNTRNQNTENQNVNTQDQGTDRNYQTIAQNHNIRASVIRQNEGNQNAVYYDGQNEENTRNHHTENQNIQNRDQGTDNQNEVDQLLDDQNFEDWCRRIENLNLLQDLLTELDFETVNSVLEAGQRPIREGNRARLSNL